jgi:hypothetical protein
MRKSQAVVFDSNGGNELNRKNEMKTKLLLTIVLLCFCCANTAMADYDFVFTSGGTWTISPGLNVHGQQRWNATDPSGRLHTGTQHRGIII